MLQDCALLEELAPDTRRRMRKTIVSAILCTDMSNHFVLTSDFKKHPVQVRGVVRPLPLPALRPPAGLLPCHLKDEGREVCVPRVPYGQPVHQTECGCTPGCSPS